MALVTTGRNDRIVAVLGGCGFIGQALVRRLLADLEIEQVVVVDNLSSGDRSLLPVDEPRLYFPGRDLAAQDVLLKDIGLPGTVYYLCGRPFVPDSFDDPEGTVRANVSVLNSFLRHNDDLAFKLVYASSGEVYGNVAGAPAAETDECDGLAKLSPYARSRIDAEQVLRQWSQKSDIEMVALRLFNVLGPAATHPYFVPDMIRQIVHADVIHHGRLDTQRDFVWIDDTVDAFTAAARARFSSFAAFNVATGYAWSMGDVLGRLLQIAKRPTVQLIHDRARDRPKELDRLVGSPLEAHRRLGWKATVSLPDALRAVYEAYLAAGRSWPYERVARSYAGAATPRSAGLLRANQDTPYSGMARVGAA